MSIDALRSAIKWAAVYRDEVDGLGVDPAQEGQVVAVVEGALAKFGVAIWVSSPAVASREA